MITYFHIFAMLKAVLLLTKEKWGKALDENAFICHVKVFKVF